MRTVAGYLTNAFTNYKNAFCHPSTYYIDNTRRILRDSIGVDEQRLAPFSGKEYDGLLAKEFERAVNEDTQSRGMFVIAGATALVGVAALLAAPAGVVAMIATVAAVGSGILGIRDHFRKKVSAEEALKRLEHTEIKSSVTAPVLQPAA